MQAIDTPLPGFTTNPSGNIRVKAPQPYAGPPIPPSPPIKFDPQDEDEAELMTYPGKTKLLAEPVFCPDCSNRIKNHTTRPATNKSGTKNYKLYICPGGQRDLVK